MASCTAPRLCLLASLLAAGLLMGGLLLQRPASGAAADSSLRLVLPRSHAPPAGAPDAPDCPAPQRQAPGPREDSAPWQEFHQQLVAEVAQGHQGQAFDVVLYGDSIFESFRGTSMGMPYCPRCEGIPQVFHKYFGRSSQSYSTLVAAIAGDECHHLLWRLQNKELLAERPPKVAVVLIGANDLGRSSVRGEAQCLPAAGRAVADGVIEVLRYIRQSAPNTQVLAVGVLPHSGSDQGPHTWPGMFTAAIEHCNALVRAHTETDSHLHFLDCGAALVEGSPATIARLLPDTLHPSADGMELVARCLQPVVDKLLQEASDTAA